MRPLYNISKMGVQLSIQEHIAVPAGMILFQVLLPHAAIDADLHAWLLIKGQVWNIVITGFCIGQIFPHRGPFVYCPFLLGQFKEAEPFIFTASRAAGPR